MEGRQIIIISRAGLRSKCGDKAINENSSKAMGKLSRNMRQIFGASTVLETDVKRFALVEHDWQETSDLAAGRCSGHVFF
jgi:hypothetical protein